MEAKIDKLFNDTNNNGRMFTILLTLLFLVSYFVTFNLHYITFIHYPDFCFVFVAFVLVWNNPILIINVLQQISRFSRSL